MKNYTKSDQKHAKYPFLLSNKTSNLENSPKKTKLKKNLFFNFEFYAGHF